MGLRITAAVLGAVLVIAGTAQIFGVAVASIIAGVLLLALALYWDDGKP